MSLTCYRSLLSVLHPDGLHCPLGHALEEGQAPHDRHREPVVDYRCRTCGKVFNLYTDMSRSAYPLDALACGRCRGRMKFIAVIKDRAVVDHPSSHSTPFPFDTVPIRHRREPVRNAGARNVGPRNAGARNVGPRNAGAQNVGARNAGAAQDGWGFPLAFAAILVGLWVFFHR